MKVDSSISLKKWAAEINKTFDFDGKKVLDVGCGDGFMARYIAETYNVDHIFGIDRGVAECGKSYTLEVGDARCLPYEDNTFDIVYSISTFEHIDGIKKTLDEVRRVLKPYGKFFIAFAPVWTSICGHHCYSWWSAFSDICKEKQEDRDEEIVNAIPAWGHLYLREPEMEEHLRKMGFSDERISNVVEYIYHGDDINRCPASEIKDYIMNSGMVIRRYYEGVTFSRKWALDQKGPSELTQDIKDRIAATRYNLMDLGIVQMRAELEKYESF